MLCALINLGIAGLEANCSCVIQGNMQSFNVKPPVNFALSVPGSSPTFRTGAVDSDYPRGRLAGEGCYGAKRSILGFSGLLSWFLFSRSAGKLVPVSLGTRDSKNLPQINNLELMGCVPWQSSEWPLLLSFFFNSLERC